MHRENHKCRRLVGEGGPTSPFKGEFKCGVAQPWVPLPCPHLGVWRRVLYSHGMEFRPFAWMLKVLRSASSLCSLQWIWERRCGGKESDFIWRAGWPRRWQTGLKITILSGSGCQALSWIRDGGGGRWETKIKKAINLANVSKNGKPQAGGCVSFLLPAMYRWTGFWTKALLTIGQKGRILWGRTLCMIIITRAMKGKSKKQFQMESELTSPCNKRKLIP